VGMQSDECVAAFEAYVLGEAGGTLEAGRLKALGGQVRARAFPIGLDTEDFLALSRTHPADQTYDRMAAHGVFRSLIVGVDRLDYSKGIPERLLGFEHYLRTHPDMVRKVLYLQIAPSSRAEVEAYQALRANVLALAGRINATWAEMDHAPVLCVNRNYSRAELAGVYRAARVGLVTPLRDGMNLVAKEYVAAQNAEDPGVLILSRFAGAARQMKDALIVNPYAREELAEAIAEALAMPKAERVRRWESLMAGVVRDDVHAWRADFIAALTQAHADQAPDAERPRKVAFTLGRGLVSALSPRRETPEPRSGRDSASSAPEWRNSVPG
ncbi:MAG TPA: trehalose-6-phosphate synthase, partial [Caulobacteraceae bacterium]|nr:trehalose-6-phosphate synthase [Caulobacteraceae bacterium]